MPISLRWSGVLLIFGPLILGYPHLIASYRFLQSRRLLAVTRLTRVMVFQTFLGATAFSTVIHFFGAQIGMSREVPYGTWEILLSVAAVAIIGLRSTMKQVLATLIWILAPWTRDSAVWDRSVVCTPLVSR